MPAEITTPRVPDALGQPSPTASVGPRPASRPLLWILAFVFYPYGPFIYLAWLRAIPPLSTIGLLIASGAVHIGLLSVLVKTNHQPWQPWLVLLHGLALYTLGGMQYWAGHAHRIWSPLALRLWRIFGWILGLMLLLNLIAQITLFHLAPIPNPSKVPEPHSARQRLTDDIPRLP